MDNQSHFYIKCKSAEIILAVALAECNCSWCKYELSQRENGRVDLVSWGWLPFSSGCLLSSSLSDLDNGIIFIEHC